ncbi:hypothetical protein EAH89_27565 [Roseomonas nepalensis]|uniref:Glycosyltransferase RgtA/B/C/D-like domain-containing protein n=1 Tax=Muricoccus nepalensis TaxID=1854500 RepID=A0A502F5Q2_9PROT|nr:hypothetical protein [Roseomonas nepalensis]TPG44260.1 hypothetical protein EAH89_27565 [Roseomonas nepalensis]
MSPPAADAVPGDAPRPPRFWSPAALDARAARGGFVGRVLDLIGPRLDPEAPEAEERPHPGWMAILSVGVALSLLMLAQAHHEGYRDRPNALLQWTAYGVMFFPVALRAGRHGTARAERIFLVALVGMAALAAKWLHSPTRFVFFDEFLHVASALDILERKRLYTTNPLLPISPAYPGLELATTALVELTGLPLFAAGYVVLAVARFLLVVGVYCLLERVTRSARVAAVACLVYMGNSGFVLFDAQFAYESLALTFFVLALLAASTRRDAAASPFAAYALTLLPLAALATTHHMSAYFTAGFFALLAALSRFSRAGAPDRRFLLVVAVAAVALPVAWSRLQGGSGDGYLGPILEKGSTELANLLSGTGRSRQLFSTMSGAQSPIEIRVFSIVALLVVVGGLLTGFFRAIAQSVRPERGWAAIFRFLRLQWSDHWLLLLALTAVGFPVSVGFRLTGAGWEIGNRMGPFVFLGAGFVIAVAMTRLWQPAGASPRRRAATAAALSVCFLGGIATGWGNPSTRTGYRVAADAASVEPMGIDAALWARDWIGPGGRFTADRINRVLLATYGRQTVVTTLLDKVDTSFVLLAPRLTGGEIGALREGYVDYVMVDMRMTTGLPRYGYYVEKGEYQEDPLSPVEADNLLKFNLYPGIDRLFDNGSHIVFGTGGLRRAR